MFDISVRLKPMNMRESRDEDSFDCLADKPFGERDSFERDKKARAKSSNVSKREISARFLPNKKWGLFGWSGGKEEI